MDPLQWPKVRMQEYRLLDLAFTQVSSSIETDGGHGLHGRVVWASRVEGARAGVAWDWSELQPGVLVITNPLAVDSNIEIETEDGKLLPLHAHVRAFNALVHGLAWQTVLNRDVEAWRQKRS